MAESMILILQNSCKSENYRNGSTQGVLNYSPEDIKKLSKKKRAEKQDTGERTEMGDTLIKELQVRIETS